MKPPMDRKAPAIPRTKFEDELQRAARSVPAERRSAARQRGEFNAECRLGPVAYVVEIRDISSAGACLHIRQGIVPRVGQDVSLSLMDGRTIDATVSRSTDFEIGVRFREPVDISDVAHFDEMGSEFYSAVLKLQMATK